MAKRNKTPSNASIEAQANAYKARAEGNAAIISALMPVMLLIVAFVIILVSQKLGVDLVPYAEAVTAALVLLGNQAPPQQL